MAVTNVDVANRALLHLGIPKKINTLSQDSREAQVLNALITTVRDELLRKAPWNFAFTYANLDLITATPGTPENPSQTFTTWAPGIPAPPWAYEYQYPVDCLRGCWIVPQFNTGFANGTPITTAITGGSPSFWNGPPIKFKVANDQFYNATAVTIASAGTGHAVGDLVQVNAQSAPPIGAPARIRVVTVNGTGGITSLSLISDIPNETGGGSYFSKPTNPSAQGDTTGSGTGSTFNVTYTSTQTDQKMILTNQEDATFAYVKQVTNPDIMDSEFIDAWAFVLAAKCAFTLRVPGENDDPNKVVANMLIKQANDKIIEARKSDGNEGLTVNDVTPDWIRLRGLQYPNWEYGPGMQFDWGPTFSMF